jgi:hypothetical protein
VKALRTWISAGAVMALLAGACDGQPADSGLAEPLRVQGGQFIEGPLPGTPPGQGSPPASARVTNVSASSRIVQPGQAGQAFDGRTSDNATSVAVRFADIGSGYWVFVLSGKDSLFPGELSWHADLDFNSDFARLPGFHPLRFVAIDGNGNAGEQSETSVCLLGKTPDNAHECDPSQPPPEAVITLAWDTDVDLDLIVVTPTLATISPKNPATELDGGAPSASAGLLDRDSLGSCVADGRRQEDLVWPVRPTGTFDVYASLFSACGKPGVSYVATVYEAQGTMPNRNLVATRVVKGRLIALDADGGRTHGQYLFSHSF